MEFADLNQAVAHLSELVAPADYPVLQPHELEDIARMCRMKDSCGRETDDPAYITTVDINLAATRLWARKAARAAGGFDFSSDNQRFDRSQVIKHCLQMQRHFQSQCVTAWPAPQTLTQQRFLLPSGYTD